METETTEETQTEVEEAPVTTNSNDELDAAQAALAVMPEETEVGSDDANAGIKAESTKLLGEVTARRAVVRALKQQEAALLAKAEAPLVVKETPKSPMDIFAEEHPGDVMPVEVNQAEKKFQKALDATEQQAKAKETEKSALTERGKGVLKRGAEKYSDFEEIHEAAADVLTNGDWVDIRESENPEDMIYKRSIARILEAGGERAKTLATRLRAKKVATESVKKKAPKEPDGSEVPESNKAQKSAHLARLESIL